MHSEADGCSKKHHNHYKTNTTSAAISYEYTKYCSRQEFAIRLLYYMEEFFVFSPVEMLYKAPEQVRILQGFVS